MFFMLRLRRMSLLLCLSVVTGFSCQGHAQDSDQVHITPAVHPGDGVPSNEHEQPQADHVKPVRVDVDIVLVPVTVVDPANRPVITLEKQDFELYEAGQQQPLRYFSTEDAPISVGILLDLSSSMKDKIDTARQALREFFENSNPQDDYFVIGFSDRPALLADATHSTASIENKLALTIPYGNTALLDSIYMGLNKLHRARYKRRALVIISDGGDNHSRYTAREIRNLVQEEDVEIYALGIFSKVFKTYEEWSGERLLTSITEATGGHTVKVNDLQDLPEAAANISRQLRNQYILGYSPTNRQYDDRWHKIKVRLVPSSDGTVLHVYSKQGYFAPHR
jgi:Ca-activated chloride channel family protein